MVLGGAESEITAGSTVVIPPKTAHFAVPHGKLVLAVVNTPPFRPENYVTFSLTRSHLDIGFDLLQYQRLMPCSTWRSLKGGYIMQDNGC